MAFGPDATSHAIAIGSGAHSITWAHTCGVGANKLVVETGAGASALSDRTVATVAYNAVPCSFIAEADDTTFEHSELWELNNPPTGSPFNIVVTYVGSPNQLGAGAISYIDAAAVDGTPATNTGTTVNPNVTVVDSAAGDHVISVSSNDNQSSTTTEAGILIWEDEDVGADSDFNAQRQVAVGPSTVCSWTNSASGGGWAAVGVAIKPLVPPPPPNPSGLEESGYFPSEPQTNPTVVSSWKGDDHGRKGGNPLCIRTQKGRFREFRSSGQCLDNRWRGVFPHADHASSFLYATADRTELESPCENGSNRGRFSQIRDHGGRGHRTGFFSATLKGIA